MINKLEEMYIHNEVKINKFNNFLNVQTVQT